MPIKSFLGSNGTHVAYWVPERKGKHTMTIGPCLCGDPYCSRCGNPAQAAFADAIEVFCEKLEQYVMDETEMEIFYNAGVEAVELHRRIGSDPPD